MRTSLGLLSLLAATGNVSAHLAKAFTPFLTPLNSSVGWIIGNDLWNITINQSYGKKLFYKNHDLIGDAVGHYAGYDGEINFLWTSASIAKQTPEYLDIVFNSTLVDLHWVIFPELAGAYQYIVNKALPTLSVLRTLYRLDNTTFTHGRTNIKDALLPPFSLYGNSTKVQDETWEQADGTFITKYDFSATVREIDFHGIYGEGFGSWYIRPGRDYINGNHLKQELTVHRESATGDALELNVVHGSHFQVSSAATFPVGKVWGPWLWYLNDGSQADASIRAKQEFTSWPYEWFNNTAFQSRGSLSGRITLSNGLPAAGAAIFLGDNNSNTTTLDQGTDYYYTAYADTFGNFNIPDVRTGIYALTAWSNGGKLSAISTTFTKNDITIRNGHEQKLGSLVWNISSRNRIFQIGDIDRKAIGFKNSGLPYQHGVAALSPANLTYTIGVSNESDWYYAQSAIGSWVVNFNINTKASKGNQTAILGLALAGYSKSSDLVISVNGVQVGSLITANLDSDPAVYRSGRIAGEWHLYEFQVGAGVLVEGANEVVFEVTRFTLWRGFLWDSVYLDWSS